MVWLKRFFILSVISVLFFSLSTTSFAEFSASELDDNEYYEYWSVGDDGELYLHHALVDPDSVLSESGSRPIEVIVVPEEYSLSVPMDDFYSVADQLPDDPPAVPLFIGSGYISGTDSQLGSVTLYTPIDYKSGVWGIDRSGYLYNVSSKSLSGYLGGVYNNSWSCSAFNYPTYRVQSGNTTVTRTLYLRPSASNLEIAFDMVPRKTESELLPYVLIGLVGVITLCCIKRSRI